MDPMRLRLIVITIIASITIVIHTVGFSTTQYATSKFQLDITCTESHYGLFRKCDKVCKWGSDQCGSMDWDAFDVKGPMVVTVIGYIGTYFAVLVYVVSIFKTVTRQVVFSAAGLLFLSALCGIIGSSLYLNGIYSYWDDHDSNAPYTTKIVDTGSGWSFSVSTLANVLKLILSIASAYLLRNYSDARASFQAVP